MDTFKEIEDEHEGSKLLPPKVATPRNPKGQIPAFPLYSLTQKSCPVQRLPFLFVTDIQAGSLVEEQVHRL
jgi:hypothetical protein